LSATEFLRFVTWRDLLDIALVAVVVYYLLLLVRGTRAAQILLGILFVGAAYQVARAAQLTTLETILERFFLLLPVAILILFQHEIRRGLANFGRNPFWRLAAVEQEASVTNDVVLAASSLASHRTGALIVIERLEGLREYIENGVRLDATLSYDLLINIFTPETPLHDGAAIVQNGRLAAAGCFLPLSGNPELSKELGSRHRAALGISEETDAVAVIVSEENGEVSIAHAGVIEGRLDAKALRSRLHQLLVTELKPGRGTAA
jgi:diadenylate cyclase